MRYLYLLRHAKSSWDYPDLDDFERPLNKRGKHDAPLMARVMKKHKVIPDIIISSPATRVAMTARIVAAVLQIDEDRLKFEHQIYDASPSSLIATLRTIDDGIQNVLLVGHNPGLTDLANFVADHPLDNIPTAGLFGITFDISHWNQISERSGKFILFEVPKKHKSSVTKKP